MIGNVPAPVQVRHHGACDASALTILPDGSLLVGIDEAKGLSTWSPTAVVKQRWCVNGQLSVQG